jgi:hypothetical protein
MSEQQRICDSSDVPDNVGTVFITDVPGSWLQVNCTDNVPGRRGE